MYEFIDVNQNKVILQFGNSAFPIKAMHVLVICRYDHQWLMTNHSIRGWEFPGGKIEGNETAEAAALREVNEETGAIVDSIHFIGEYMVEDVQYGPFVKAIFFANIKGLEQKGDYMETAGPVLVGDDLISTLHKKEFSFIMKDEVIPTTITRIKELGLYK